jgi:hypothetical protein
MRRKFWSENVNIRDHSKDLGVDGKVVLESGIWGFHGGEDSSLCLLGCDAV